MAAKKSEEQPIVTEIPFSDTIDENTADALNRMGVDVENPPAFFVEIYNNTKKMVDTCNPGRVISVEGLSIMLALSRMGEDNNG